MSVNQELSVHGSNELSNASQSLNDAAIALFVLEPSNDSTENNEASLTSDLISDKKEIVAYEAETENKDVDNSCLSDKVDSVSEVNTSVDTDDNGTIKIKQCKTMKSFLGKNTDVDTLSKITRVKRLSELSSSPHGSRESSRSLSPEVLSKIQARIIQKKGQNSDADDSKDEVITSGDRDNSSIKSLKKKKRHFKGLTYSLPGSKKKRKKPSIDKEAAGDNDDLKDGVDSWADGSDDQDSVLRMMENYSPASVISSKAESEDCLLYSSEIENEESNAGSDFKECGAIGQTFNVIDPPLNELDNKFADKIDDSIEEVLDSDDTVACKVMNQMQDEIELLDAKEKDIHESIKNSEAQSSHEDVIMEEKAEQDNEDTPISIQIKHNDIVNESDDTIDARQSDVNTSEPCEMSIEENCMDRTAADFCEDMDKMSETNEDNEDNLSKSSSDSEESDNMNDAKDDSQISEIDEILENDNADNDKDYQCPDSVNREGSIHSISEYDEMSRSDTSDGLENKDNDEGYFTRNARRTLSVADSVKRRRSTRKYSDDDFYDFDLMNAAPVVGSEPKNREPPSLWAFVPCTCTSNTPIKINIDVSLNDEYCKALDGIDDHVIGCRNKVVDPVLRRSSQKITYQLFCRLHLKRLKEHQCCPNCGLFCTQGKFARCIKENGNHLFHRKCFLYIDEKPCCPHCGETKKSFIESIRLELKVPKSLRFYLQQYFVQSKRSQLYSVKTDLEEVTKQIKNEKEYIIPESGQILSAADFLEDRDQTLLNDLLSTLDKNEYQNIGKAPNDLYNAVLDNNLKLALHLLYKGMDPNKFYHQHGKQTAIHAAAANGSVLMMHILHQAGASLDTRDEELQSPLMIASCKNHFKVVKFLVEGGADLRLRGQDGLTALHMAAKFGNLESCFAILTFSQDSRSLINIQDDGGWTPLVWGTEHKHTVIVRYLLKNGANPQIQDIECNTALHWAAYSGNKDIALMFLCYGCQLDWVNVNGDTPLHIAARRDCYDCVLLFLDNGASTDVKNRDGERPIDSAALVPESKSLSVLAVSMRLKGLLPVHNTKAKRRILSNDISMGKERIPVQCVNELDDAELPTDYMYVSDNCETSLMYINKTITSLMVHCSCEGNCLNTSCLCCTVSLQCWYDSEGRLLDTFNYTDPPMLFECNQTCKCHVAYCKNRVFQKGIIIQMELFRTHTKGWGVRTLEPIPKGTYVCEYVGEIITDHEADGREDDSYLFDLDNKDSETYCIDACRYGNLARFINHQCSPNLVPVRVFVDHQDTRFPRIAFFANRDIAPYDELGFDYGEKFWIIKYKLFTCACGSGACKYSKSKIHETLEKYKLSNTEENVSSQL